MYVKNAVYKEIEMDWASITLPLKEGTPVNVYGKIENGAGAIGLVPQKVTVLPVVKAMRVLVGGSVSLPEVEAAYGATLNEAAKEAMNGITFYGKYGSPEPDPVYEIPETPLATKTAAGLVKMAANVAAAADDAPTKAEFDALLDALIEAGIMEAPAEAAAE